MDDRLSELPDSLILVILTFLPMIDVVRTTLLSKRWKNLWTAVPSLHFHHSTYYTLEEFETFAFSAIARWRGAKVLKFSIEIHFYLHIAHDIDHLLLFAFANQVEELHVDATPGFWHPLMSKTSRYAPHPRLYSCSSITKLSLVSVELNVGESVRWDRLRSLTMENVESLSEHAMSQIICGAPLLEVLSLSIKESVEDLNIQSTSLKMLKIIMCGLVSENDKVVSVWGPNLESLELCGISYTRCLLEVPSLTNAVLGFDEFDYFVLLEEMLRQVFLSICHVEKLSLTHWCIKVLREMRKDHVVLFSNVTFLKLYPVEADVMVDVLDMFPELMILIVEQNELQLNSLFQDEEPYVVEVDALVPKTISPCVSLLKYKTVEISWNARDTSIISVIEKLLKNARTLEKMVLRLRTHGDDPETFILAEEKVLTLARSSPYANVIISKG